MINEKYSNNGYDPLSSKVIESKANLKDLLEQRVLNLKEYSAAITNLKRGWKRTDLSKIDPAEVNDTEIVNACFAQDVPFTPIFPGAKNVVFTNCNLDNCTVPATCTINGGTNKQFKMQKDGEDWIVDEALKPVSPKDIKAFQDLGLSTSAKDIPAETLEQSVVVQATTLKVIEDRKAKLIALAQNPTALNEWAEKGGNL